MAEAREAVGLAVVVGWGQEGGLKADLGFGFEELMSSHEHGEIGRVGLGRGTGFSMFMFPVIARATESLPRAEPNDCWDCGLCPRQAPPSWLEGQSGYCSRSSQL